MTPSELALLRVDANGLPIGHVEAVEAAAREWTDYLNNELMPTGPLYINVTEAGFAVERLFSVYWHAIRRVQEVL